MDGSNFTKMMYYLTYTMPYIVFLIVTRCGFIKCPLITKHFTIIKCLVKMTTKIKTRKKYKYCKGKNIIYRLQNQMESVLS